VLGLIGAAQKSARLNQTFKGKNLAAIVKSEATTLGKDTLIQGLPAATRVVTNKADGWLFPKASAPNQVGPNLSPNGLDINRLRNTR
jgi:Na+-transporting NADH:ubiquinone oxidoreductase subunit NqrA